jgi:hypothetical protein
MRFVPSLPYTSVGIQGGWRGRIGWLARWRAVVVMLCSVSDRFIAMRQPLFMVCHAAHPPSTCLAYQNQLSATPKYH